jgi:O-methyltransferase
MEIQHPEECAANSSSAIGKPIRHPAWEIFARARDLALVADTAMRAMRMAWHLVSPSEFSTLYRQVRAYTMCSNARLLGLYRGVQYIVKSNVRGDLVECGCARGGSAALLGLTLQRMKTRRPIWLFDTFAGLPAPTLEDPDFKIAELYTGTCAGTLEEVRRLFTRLHLMTDAHFVQGLFQETLVTTSPPAIALLHLDGDWYESVKVCLDNLYDKVVPGGVIQFDDYGYWKGARKAVDEFLERRAIKVSLERLDYSGRTLIKPAPSPKSEIH